MTKQAEIKRSEYTKWVSDLEVIGGSGWIMICEKIKTILADGLDVARQVVGPREDASNAAKDADCTADRLDTELAMILSNAEDLVNQLKRIAAKF